MSLEYKMNKNTDKYVESHWRIRAAIESSAWQIEMRVPRISMACQNDFIGKSDWSMLTETAKKSVNVVCFSLCCIFCDIERYLKCIPNVWKKRNFELWFIPLTWLHFELFILNRSVGERITSNANANAITIQTKLPCMAFSLVFA